MSNKNKDDKAPMQKTVRPLVLVSQLGYNMLSPIGAGIAVGYFFDKWLDCSPWGLLFFTFMGIGGAYKSALVTFGKYTANRDEEDEEGKDEKK